MKEKLCGTCHQFVPVLWRAKTRDTPSACKSCAGKAAANKPNITYLKPVSDKQAERIKLYKKVRAEFMRNNPVCMFPFCEAEATDLHHSKGRIGDLLTDVLFFKSLCRQHHSYIETHPDVAKEYGLSFSRLDK